MVETAVIGPADLYLDYLLEWVKLED